MATMYDSPISEQIAQISKQFDKYHNYFLKGEDTLDEYVDNCGILLDNIENAAAEVARRFVSGKSDVNDIDMLSLQDMYKTINNSIERHLEEK